MLMNSISHNFFGCSFRKFQFLTIRKFYDHSKSPVVGLNFNLLLDTVSLLSETFTSDAPKRTFFLALKAAFNASDTYLKDSCRATFDINVHSVLILASLS